MKNTFTRNFFALLLLCAAVGMQAQNANVLWEEDFADGIPAGWTNEDAAGVDAVFTWCNDPFTGQSDGCPRIWDDGTNQQIPFAAETVNNGFVTMDSDLVGQITTNHISQLTTGLIDLTAAPEAWFSMQTHIGVFTLDASDNAILRVSTDLENWTEYTLFPNLTTGVRWSENPADPVVNISDAAAGNMVYLQFQWTGNYEYHWSLDDLVIFDADPRFANDLQVDGFFALPPNYSYPADQLETFGFLLDVSNVGAETQTGITATVTVEEDGADVFMTTLEYEDIPIDSTVENQALPEQFTPTGDAGTVYTGTYEVSAAAEDDDPTNNTQDFEFVVSDSLFSKAPGIDGIISPAFNDGESDYQWAYGCHYHVVNGAGNFARTVSFAIDGDEDNIDQNVFLSIYKVTDDGSTDPADFRVVTPDERGNREAVAVYTITGDEEPSDIITLPIYQLTGEPLELEDNTDYLVMAEFLVTGEVQVVMGANRSLNYSAQDLLMESQGLFRFTQVLAVGNDIATEDYSTGGFAGDVAPYVTLSIGDPLVTSDVNDLLSENNIVTVTPNPVSTVAILNLELEEVSQTVDVTIFDAKGSVQSVQSYENVQNTQVDLDVRNLAEGMYFVRVRTDAGVATRNIVVAK